MSRQRPREERAPDIAGVFALDKPGGVTSQGALNDLKRALNVRKCGHSGTLDPLATGLLIAATGECTRFLAFLIGSSKRYEATMRVGVTSDTFDSTGNLVVSGDPSRVSLRDVTAASSAFLGVISQVPPRFSALKVDGRRAYDLAREEVAFDLEPREVTVTSLEVAAGQQPDEYRLTMECTSGTYVRSLIHDLGASLGVGAVMSALRRTEIGSISLQRAKPPATVTRLDGLRPLEVFPEAVETTLGSQVSTSPWLNGAPGSCDDLLDGCSMEPGRRAFLLRKVGGGWDEVVGMYVHGDDHRLLPLAMMPLRRSG